MKKNILFFAILLFSCSLKAQTTIEEYEASFVKIQLATEVYLKDNFRASTKDIKYSKAYLNKDLRAIENDFQKETQAKPVTDALVNIYIKKEQDMISQRYPDYIKNKDEYITSLNSNMGAKAAGDPCTNAGFEDGTAAGWNGYTGRFGNPNADNPNTPAIVPGRHTIMTVSDGNDFFGGFPCVMPGGNYSLRLGNKQYQSEAEQISQTFKVANVEHPSFTYSYAVVLQDGQGQHDLMQTNPYFQVEFIDDAGIAIPCTGYKVVAKANILGFQSSTKDASVKYRGWTTISVDLTAYKGKNVTIRFTTSDCGSAAHFGYAYIDASCGEFGIMASQTSICPGSSTMLTAPAGAGSYSWIRNDKITIAGHNYTIPISVGNTQIITVNQPGTYTVTMTPIGNPDNPSCTYSATITIGALPVPTADAGVDKTICKGSCDIIGTTSTDVLNYSWSPAASLDSSTIAKPRACPTEAKTTYTVIVTNGSGCTAKDAVIISLNPTPVANAGLDSIICKGTCVKIGKNPDKIILNPYIADLYNWSPSTGLNSAIRPNPTACLTVVGSYTYTCKVTNVFGCTATDDVTITVIDRQPITNNTIEQPGPVCSNSQVTIIGSPPAGGSNSYTYQWQVAATINGNEVWLNIPESNNRDYTVTSPGNGLKYRRVVTDALPGGCGGSSISNVVTLTVNLAPEANAGDPQTLGCGVTSTKIGAPRNRFDLTLLTYKWTASVGPNPASTSNPTVSPIQTTTYYLEVKDPFTGCTATDSVVVTVETGIATWPIVAGGSNSVAINRDMVRDNEESTYLGGIFQGTVTFGSGTNAKTVTSSHSTNEPDYYIAKYNCNNDLLWLVTGTGMLAHNPGINVGIDNDHNVFAVVAVSLGTSHAIKYGAGAIVEPAINGNLLALKFNAGGGYVKSNSRKGIYDGWNNKMKVDKAGNVYILADQYNSSSAIIIRLDNSLNNTSDYSFTTKGNVYSMSIDKSSSTDYIYIVGSFIDIPSWSLSGGGIYAAKFHLSGSTLVKDWHKGINADNSGSTVNAYANYSGNGFLYIGGKFINKLSTLNSANTAGFILKLNNTNGNIVRKEVIGGSQEETVYDITGDNGGNIYGIGTKTDVNGNSYMMTFRYNSNETFGWMNFTAGAYGFTNYSNPGNTIVYEAGCFAGNLIPYNVNSTGILDMFAVRENTGGVYFRKGKESVAENNIGDNLSDGIAENLKLYPNPFSGQISLEFNLEKEENVSVTIWDIAGRKIATVREELMTLGYHKLEWIPTESQSNGIYFVKINIGERVERRKIVLQK